MILHGLLLLLPIAVASSLFFLFFSSLLLSFPPLSLYESFFHLATQRGLPHPSLVKGVSPHMCSSHYS
uniref:Putative secreted peptide n=1 Tax=Anopheles braziliensis TaxID=58242 RepID=A0A2M3ZXJ1_9DIPT